MSGRRSEPRIYNRCPDRYRCTAVGRAEPGRSGLTNIRRGNIIAEESGGPPGVDSRAAARVIGGFRVQTIRDRVSRFLTSVGMDAESVDIGRNCDRFIHEMDRGLKLEGGSLQMIPTYISAEGSARQDEPVIVLDAGGTNLRAAVVHFDREGKAVTDQFTRCRMPGTDAPVDSDAFFDRIAELVEPLLPASDRIAFCFSYPAKPRKDKDGAVILVGKEVKVEGITGKLLGVELIAALERRGARPHHRVIVLNDSVATLLSGKAFLHDRVFDGYIGFILGTGTNTCYIEQNENIRALEADYPAGSMLVNTESGGYDGFPLPELVRRFDATTKKPGEYLCEKMISGRYQGGIVQTLVQAAAQAGLFSQPFTAAVAGLEDLTSYEIDQFLYYPYGDNRLAVCCGASGDADRETLYYLIDAVFERAARLVCVNLAAVMQKTDTGADPCRPVCITADGTAFYHSKLFRDKLNFYVHSFIEGQLHRYCEFVKVDNATLLGTAIAGLLN